MIQNLWQNIVLYCGNHEKENELVKMTIQNGPSSLFYACPKYYPDNREVGEKACPNRINFVDFEKFVNHLSDIIEDANKNFETVGLTGHKWTYKTITFEVFSYKEDKIKVKMINKKALK